MQRQCMFVQNLHFVARQLCMIHAGMLCVTQAPCVSLLATLSRFGCTARLDLRIMLRYSLLRVWH